MSKSMLFVLLDESGSMSGLQADVINGINAFIEEQRKLPDPAVIAVANFGTHINGMIKFIRPMTDLKEVALLTHSDYLPSGGTPLLDATGRSIQALDADWVREQPDRCVFVTFTDGEENSSKEFTTSKIKQLIQAREKSGLWLFSFLGANIDSFQVSQSMGYSSSNTANYTASSRGIRGATRTLSDSIGTVRSMSADNFACAAAGSASIGLGGNIQEDGSVTNKVDVKVTPATHPGFGQMDAKVTSAGIPPAAAMQQESWVPPTSSALFDPKVEAWKPPV